MILSFKMKIRFQILLALLILLIPCKKSYSQEVVRLWEGQTKPFYKENDLKEYEKENWGARCVFNVTDPTISVYRAKGDNSGISVIILPGGGYTAEAIDHEGEKLAAILSGQGITAAVLKYRLPNPKSSDQPNMVPLSDARRALKLIRQLADKYGLDKNKVGVIGFSAGSHLATVTSLWKSKDKEENPDFSGLIYGVTNLNAENLKWLEDDLYFRNLTEEELSRNRLLDLVTPDSPPAFMVHAIDDNVCNVSETTLYANKLIENHVEAEVHLFQKGGHGFGIGRKEDGTDQWVPLFVNWLKRITKTNEND